MDQERQEDNYAQTTADEVPRRTPLTFLLSDMESTRHMAPSQRVRAVMPKLMRGICTSRPYASDDKLMFNPRSISETSNPLAKLFRYVMYKLRFTEDEYRARAFGHGLREGKAVSQINSDISNAKKAICGKNLTIKQLRRNLEYIGYNLTDIRITVEDAETGEYTSYAISDLQLLDRTARSPKEDDDVSSEEAGQIAEDD